MSIYNGGGTLLKLSPQKIIAKFDFYIHILLLLSLTFDVLKNSKNLFKNLSLRIIKHTLF